MFKLSLKKESLDTSWYVLFAGGSNKAKQNQKHIPIAPFLPYTKFSELHFKNFYLKLEWHHLTHDERKGLRASLKKLPLFFISFSVTYF